VGQRAANSGWPNGSNCAVNGKWGTPMGRRRSRKSMCRNPLLSKCPRLKKCPGRCPGALCHQAVHQVARLLRHSRALLARSEESRHSEGAAAAAPPAPINNFTALQQKAGDRPRTAQSSSTSAPSHTSALRSDTSPASRSPPAPGMRSNAIRSMRPEAPEGLRHMLSSRSSFWISALISSLSPSTCMSVQQCENRHIPELFSCLPR
jgi:hypothetical protein